MHCCVLFSNVLQLFHNVLPMLHVSTVKVYFCLLLLNADYAINNDYTLYCICSTRFLVVRISTCSCLCLKFIFMPIKLFIATGRQNKRWFNYCQIVISPFSVNGDFLCYCIWRAMSIYTYAVALYITCICIIIT